MRIMMREEEQVTGRSPLKVIVVEGLPNGGFPKELEPVLHQRAQEDVARCYVRFVGDSRIELLLFDPLTLTVRSLYSAVHRLLCSVADSDTRGLNLEYRLRGVCWTRLPDRTLGDRHH